MLRVANRSSTTSTGDTNFHIYGGRQFGQLEWNDEQWLDRCFLLVLLEHDQERSSGHTVVVRQRHVILEPVGQPNDHDQPGGERGRLGGVVQHGERRVVHVRDRGPDFDELRHRRNDGQFAGGLLQQRVVQLDLRTGRHRVGERCESLVVDQLHDRPEPGHELTNIGTNDTGTFGLASMSVMSGSGTNSTNSATELQRQRHNVEHGQQARRSRLAGVHRWPAYYFLLQIAHLLLQLLEKGSLLRQLAKDQGKRTAVELFGSLKNIARCACWRACGTGIGRMSHSTSP